MTKLIFDSIYSWRGGAGCWFSSRENLPIGTTRYIRNKLFYVYAVQKAGNYFWQHHECWWVLTEQTYDHSEITKFKQSL